MWTVHKPSEYKGLVVFKGIFKEGAPQAGSKTRELKVEESLIVYETFLSNTKSDNKELKNNHSDSDNNVKY